MQSLIEELYREYDKRLRTKRLETVVVLGFLLVPSFGMLDLIMYSELATLMIFVRLIVVIFLLISFLLLRKGFFSSIEFMGLLCPSVVFLSINFLILFTDGGNSPYYAGLNLVLVGLSVLMPWNFYETFLMSLMVLFSYVATVVINSNISGIDYDVPLFINNLFFISATSVFCIVSNHLNSKSRFKEFCLNFELEEKNKKLSKIDKLKTQFFSNISHEFRTPLTLIIGPIQDILHDPFNKLSPKINNTFNIVQQNGLRLLKLVNDLLDVIRLEEGKVNLDLKKVEINRLVSSLSDSMMHLAKMQKIRLKKNIGTTDAFIKADKSAIDKIIINILNNAIKFTNKGGKITISTVVDDSKLLIKIEDSGIGIGNKDLPYIFNRFAQADSSNTREYSGTGIGLALVKELVELQNGKVLVKSKLKKGTEFILEFPIFYEENDAVIKEKEAIHPEENKLLKIHQTAHKMGNILQNKVDTPNVDNSNNSFEKGSIVVVDDESNIRNYIVELLRDQGYNVKYAIDGESGLRIIKKVKPDLVVVDVMLPKIDGLEICQSLKTNKETKLIKIVLLTARVDDEAKLIALKNGADDFLTKPFNSLEIKSRIKNLIQASKLQREVQSKNEKLFKTLQELKSTQSKLIQSEKINALGTMAAGLLHEVNNPMNYALTALGMIKEDSKVTEDTDLRDMVNDVGDGMDRIKNIITDLRAFAYPERSTMEVGFLIFDATKHAIRFTSYDCKGVDLKNEVDESLLIKGSQAHIAQVLINFISNALRAINRTDKKGLIIIGSEKGKKKIRIFVKDNGCGMDKETKKKIFDPFFTTSDVGEGMGMGLSICHTIIKNHGGELSVESKEGEGSKFCFDLNAA